jgi:hypothetical protein
MDKSEALQQAKLNYIKNAKGIYAHPAFWSPFIQMGDTNPVNLSPKGHNTMYKLFICSIVLLLICVFFMYKKIRKSVS